MVAELLAEYRHRYTYLFTCVSIACVIFIIDLLIPLGVASGTGYVVVVLLAVRISEPATITYASLCSVLTIVGGLLSPVSLAPLWQTLANRFLALFVIWITARYGIRYRRKSLALNKSENLAQSVLDTVLDPLIMIDDRGTIVTINPATERNFGYSRDELVGQNINMLMPSPHREQHDEYLARYLRTGEKKIIGIGRDTEARRKDGTRFPINLQVTEVKVDGQRMFTGLIRDITGQRLHEEELKISRDIAVKANHAKSAFLATMSHELRTPLNAIIGFSEMIKEDVVVEDGRHEQLLADLNKIEYSGRHLLSVINNVLDISKIEAGKMELVPEESDIRTLIYEVAESVEPLVKENGNTLEIYCSGVDTVSVDPVRLRQCLINLLGNAARFTENGRIIIELSLVADEQSWLAIKVKDTGTGMTSEQLQMAFAPFAQVDMTNARKKGGTGLGLTLSRNLVQLMGGDITVQSTPGAGSNFTVWIPYGEGTIGENRHIPISEAGDMTVPVRDDPHAPLIIVIDDDQYVCEMMKRRLGQEGYRVVSALDGEKGLALIRKQRPIAIILDILMPNLSGWEVLYSLKADPDIEDIPVIVCSIVDDYSQGISLGVTDYLSKPVDHRRVIRLLEKYRPIGTDGTALIIEDEDVTRRLINRLLTKEGWKVVEAHDGWEGLEQLDRSRPDLVLLDLVMPNLDGFEFLTLMKARAEYAAVPVVIVSSKDLNAYEKGRLNGRVEAFIDKDSTEFDALLLQVCKQINECVLYKSPDTGEPGCRQVLN